MMMMSNEEMIVEMPMTLKSTTFLNNFLFDKWVVATTGEYILVLFFVFGLAFFLEFFGFMKWFISN